MVLKYLNPQDVKVGHVLAMHDGDKEVVKRKRYAAKGIRYNRLTLVDGTVVTRRDQARIAVIR